MKKISNVHTLLFQTINTFENLESPSHEFVGTAHDGKRALLFFTIVADEYRDFLAILYSFSLKTIATIICSSLRAGRIINLGKFDLEGVDQNDWEDITMLEYNGIDYIYVSDTGNNWDGHCRGTDNYEDMRVYRFPEPDWSRFRNGVATIPASDITTMILKNPNQPTECDDRTKQDFECLMADQISGDVYLVQKNVFGTDVSLYKFRPTANSETITLKEVGKIVSKKSSLSGPTYPWPMGITAGDISRNGRLILIRNYPVLRMWERMENQSVEDAILNNEPCELPLKDEPLGESIAIRIDDDGFVTTSDGQAHAPIYLYEFY